MIDSRGTAIRSRMKRAALSICRAASGARPSGGCASAGSAIAGSGRTRRSRGNRDPRHESRRRTIRRATTGRRSGARSTAPTGRCRRARRGRPASNPRQPAGSAGTATDPPAGPGCKMLFAGIQLRQLSFAHLRLQQVTSFSRRCAWVRQRSRADGTAPNETSECYRRRRQREGCGSWTAGSRGSLSPRRY
jgi:hypothetical protein